jgi:hypothetical protein
MATMNPVLRLRRAFRSVADSEPRSDEQVDEVAEEAADAVSEYGYSRQESDLRFERMMAEIRQQTAEIRQQTAEMRQYMADLRNQIILAVLVIAATMTTIITLAIAVFD